MTEEETMKELLSTLSEELIQDFTRTQKRLFKKSLLKLSPKNLEKMPDYVKELLREEHS